MTMTIVIFVKFILMYLFVRLFLSFIFGNIKMKRFLISRQKLFIIVVLCMRYDLDKIPSYYLKHTKFKAFSRFTQPFSKSKLCCQRGLHHRFAGLAKLLSRHVASKYFNCTKFKDFPKYQAMYAWVVSVTTSYVYAWVVGVLGPAMCMSGWLEC